MTKSEGIPLLLLAGCVVAACVNAILRGWNSVHLQFYTILALEVLAVAYFFAVVPRSFRQVSRLLYVIAAMLVVVVVGLFLLPGAVGEGGVLSGKTVATPFGRANLNAFATFLCSVSVVLIGMILDEKRLAVKVLLGTVVALLVAALLLTQSRGAWLGFGVAAVYLVSRARSFWLTVAAAAVVLALLSVESLRHALLVRVGDTTMNDPSLTGRFVLWAYAWKVAKANLLLGVGMENFRYVKHFFGYPLPIRYALQFNAHNLYLEFLVDLGALGLTCLLWILVGASLRLDGFARSRGSGGRGLAIGLTAGLIAYAVHGLLDALTWQHGAFMLLGMLLGLAMCVRRIGSPSLSAPVRAPAFSSTTS